MFGLAAVQVSQHVGTGAGLRVGELVAAAGLIAVILTLAGTGRASLSAAAVASWIGAAYWFTSSTSFANPAVTIARVFSDTFAASHWPRCRCSSSPRSSAQAWSRSLYPDTPSIDDDRAHDRADQSVERTVR